MWKINRADSISISPDGQQSSSAPATPANHKSNCRPVSAQTESCIGKGLKIAGQVTGSEPLFIDGSVEGSVNLPGSRVTVGGSGQVTASITAADILVMGKVRGNLKASNLLDIRAQGSVTGDVTTARLSIEEGAYFKGGVSVERAEAEAVAIAETIEAVSDIHVHRKPSWSEHPDPGNLRVFPLPHSVMGAAN